MKFISKVYDENLTRNTNNFYKEITWTLQEKVEYDVNLLALGALTLPVNTIEDIRLVVIEATGEATITLTGAEVVQFGIKDFFAFSPSELFSAGLVSIGFADTSGEENTIKVRVYGYTPDSDEEGESSSS